MSSLPKDLVSDILSLLPVENLLRLRLVCKSWKSLIDSRDFVGFHLSRSPYRHVIARDEFLHSMTLDKVDKAPVVTADKIEHHPLWCQDYGTKVWGSCNGLLCLSNSLDTLAIYNFSTRKSRKLPYAAIEFKDLRDYVDIRVYGFGYDKTSNDYKVVRIVVLRGKDGSIFDNEVKVYSLKSHEWHRVQKFPPKCHFSKRAGGVLAGGCLHWVVAEGEYMRNGGKIVTFDLERETFGELEQPVCLNMSCLLGLQRLNGCLSISYNYYLDHIDLWVMKEYGVKESWTKLVSIRQTDLAKPFHFLHPITYSRSGSELLFDKDADELVWYDIEKKNMRFVKLRRMRGLMQVDVCVESLVPLPVVESCKKKQKEKEKEENNMDNFLSKGFKLVL